MKLKLCNFQIQGFFLFFKAVKDYRLFIFVGILFAIDTVLLTSWQIVDPLKIFKDISQTQVDKFMRKKKYSFNELNQFRRKMKIL
jgi:hypothetical protein